MKCDYCPLGASDDVCAEFDGTLEPMCSYRGGRCTEFNCCGLNEQFKGGESDE